MPNSAKGWMPSGSEMLNASQPRIASGHPAEHVRAGDDADDDEADDRADPEAGEGGDDDAGRAQDGERVR